MKTTDVYGAKRLALLYLLPALFLLLGGGGLLAARLLLGYPFISYFVALAWLAGLYFLYLSLFEAFFRYKTLCAIEGKDVIATITHIEGSTGKISRHALARYEEEGELIEGRLYGSFFKSFAKSYQDGDEVRVRLLKTKEFLLYEKQDPKSSQNPRH
jgi:membrane protein implicated in regulation of membrane protease activity